MPLYAGFDLGGTQVKYGLLDERNRIVFKDKAPTPAGMEELLELFGELWQRLKKRQSRKIKAVGLGIPGIFSLSEQKILQSPNIPALDGFDLHPALSRVMDVPFWIDNDANMAAYGEFRAGAGKGVLNMIHLTLGTGVGSGILIDGNLLHGSCGFAAEMGHIVVNPEGERCNCGSLGCLETEAAAGPIVRNYRKLAGIDENLTPEEIARRARQGDRNARKAYGLAGYYLGIGLGSAINLLNPEKILIGGGIMESGDLLLPRAIEEARARSYRASFSCCSIEKASLDNDAGLIGAACWAREQLSKEKR
ncbi:MAG: ROK family protein [Candidatus Aminicenantes bacterium]|nr:ROK family protein [Candidatus Aminicenantes bacterium]